MKNNFNQTGTITNDQSGLVSDITRLLKEETRGMRLAGRSLGEISELDAPLELGGH
jgi:hypothetical protein